MLLRTRFLVFPSGLLPLRLAALLLALCCFLPGCGAGGSSSSSALGATADRVSAPGIIPDTISSAPNPTGASTSAPSATPTATPDGPVAPAASPSATPLPPPVDPEPPVPLAAPPEASLALPLIGDSKLTILSPTVLELLLVNTADAAAAPTVWNFVALDGTLTLPAPGDVSVTVNGHPATVLRSGFKRRARYASPYGFDLRIASCLYLELAAPLSDGAEVRVTNPDEKVWPSTTTFTGTLTATRVSPAIHVNQEGYLPGYAKKARAGYYLGSMGELPVPSRRFTLLDDGGKGVFQGDLRPRPESGAPVDPPPYQQVYEADFTAFDTPGRYRLAVEGLGVSPPFLVSQSLAANATRAYALGIYHKRCGSDNTLPFTRFQHAACHLASAQIPDMSPLFNVVNLLLAQSTAVPDPYQTAPALSSIANALYAFTLSGSVDAHGGHHDAGDYSKYTPQSAQLIHYLVFAVDNFPGVAALDNLGLPESGDGRSDMLALARWEAEYLCRIQDADGGFYYMTYPRDTRYESSVLPENGLPQVVYPKTTTATAAATAALAQIASSPTFRRQFPEEAARYMARAWQGWRFLERAWALHGKQGAYQALYTYGMEFADLDEIVWAETEMYLATGDPAIHARVVADLHPADPALLRWGWWRMFESYGCAIRAYAFGARSGRQPPAALDSTLLTACEAQVAQAGQDQVDAAQASAYGLSYARYDKIYGTASWYFGGDRAFDALVAYCVQPRPDLMACVISNLDYELGANPSNVSFVTGMGWGRQRVIVDQYAFNDRRVLPPSGIPSGNLTAHPPASLLYGVQLLYLSYPADDIAGYGIYDRWTDAWNTDAECTTALAARGLATHSFLMGSSWAKLQPWRAASATIEGAPATTAVGSPVTVRLQCPEMNLEEATRIVWERAGGDPVFGGPTFTFTPRSSGPAWIEAEAQWRDGRRAFAVVELNVSP